MNEKEKAYNRICDFLKNGGWTNDQIEQHIDKEPRIAFNTYYAFLNFYYERGIKLLNPYCFVVNINTLECRVVYYYSWLGALMDNKKKAFDEAFYKGYK